MSILRLHLRNYIAVWYLYSCSTGSHADTTLLLLYLILIFIYILYLLHIYIFIIFYIIYLLYNSLCNVSITFLCAMTKLLTEQLKGGSLSGFIVQGDTCHHGREGMPPGMSGSGSHCSYTQQAQKCGCWCSLSPLDLKQGPSPGVCLLLSVSSLFG